MLRQTLEFSSGNHHTKGFFGHVDGRAGIGDFEHCSEATRSAPQVDRIGVVCVGQKGETKAQEFQLLNVRRVLQMIPFVLRHRVTGKVRCLIKHALDATCKTKDWYGSATIQDEMQKLPCLNIDFDPTGIGNYGSSRDCHWSSSFFADFMGAIFWASVRSKRPKRYEPLLPLSWSDKHLGQDRTWPEWWCQHWAIRTSSNSRSNQENEKLRSGTFRLPRKSLPTSESLRCRICQRRFGRNP